MSRLKVLVVLLMLQLKAVCRKPRIRPVHQVHVSRSHVGAALLFVSRSDAQRLEGRSRQCYLLLPLLLVIISTDVRLRRRRRPDARRRRRLAAHLRRRLFDASPHASTIIILDFLAHAATVLAFVVLLVVSRSLDAPSNCEPLFRLSTRGFIILFRGSLPLRSASSRFLLFRSLFGLMVP